MINKLEAGKTYRLIDKEGYLGNSCFNTIYFDSYFKNDCVSLERVENDIYGVVQGNYVIHASEVEYFELVDGYECLQTINTPFGELDKQTKKDLLCAWVDGAEIEMQGSTQSYWSHVWKPNWLSNCTYRVKPTISAKETDKAKLISEAQQQLRDAQEALSKAQQL